MDRDEWQKRYDAAKSMRALAAELGVHPSWVSHELRRLGIKSRSKMAGRPAQEPSPEACAEWKRLYEEAGSVSALARKMGKNHGTIKYHLKRHGIEVASAGYKSPKTVTHKGADHASWKGGTYYHTDGYVFEYAPDHPDAARAKGYVLQHRLVMEQKLGRPLAPGEVVHHINEIKSDNRPENLELLNRSTHMKHHKAHARRDDHGRFVE